MSKSKPAGRKDKLDTRTSAASAAKPVEYLPPFQPRRGLTLLLGVILFLWMLGLLALYFTTVFPARRQSPRPPTHVPETALRRVNSSNA